MRRRWSSILVLAAVLTAAAPVSAQTPPPARPDTLERPAPNAPVQRDTAAGQPRAASPGGSFARSILVPGWGQAAHGAYLRGGVYFAAQAASGFMVFKTMVKLGEARGLAARRSAYVRDSLVARDPGLGDPDSGEARESLAALVESDSLVTDRLALVEAREQQREDWIAWAVVWTLASGIDAFVTAHLSDFPGGVVAEPRGTGGGMRFGVRWPVGDVP